MAGARSSLRILADFALWTSACEPALWPAGTFARAYAANRRAAIESIIEAYPIATCLRAPHAAVRYDPPAAARRQYDAAGLSRRRQRSLPPAVYRTLRAQAAASGQAPAQLMAAILSHVAGN